MANLLFVGLDIVCVCHDLLFATLDCSYDDNHYHDYETELPIFICDLICVEIRFSYRMSLFLVRSWGSSARSTLASLGTRLVRVLFKLNSLIF